MFVSYTSNWRDFAFEGGVTRSFILKCDIVKCVFCISRSVAFEEPAQQFCFFNGTIVRRELWNCVEDIDSDP